MIPSIHSEPLVPRLHSRRAHSPVKLLCLPHVGGSAHAFTPWPLDPLGILKLCPVELAGRGRRFADVPHRCFRTLIPVLAGELRCYLDGPYALFGHSMGALIAFELCRYWRAQAAPLPLHLFVSGCRAPQLLIEREEPAHGATIDLLARLRRLNGTPAELLENPEFLEAMRPLLTADFQLFDSYRYTLEPPLAIPITAFGGENDPHVDKPGLDGWACHTTAAFESSLYAGDHFFLNGHRETLLRCMASALRTGSKGVL